MALIRWRLIAVACLAAVVAAIPATVAGQRETAERHVFVGVANARGEPVEGLTPKDFIIREDDVAREVLRVSPTSPPSHVAVLVDNTDAASPMLIELRTSLLTFVRTMTGLPTSPSVWLGTFAERPTVAVDWTTNDIVLERGVRQIFQRPGSGAYLLDAIWETCLSLRKIKAARPVIVAFTMDASQAFSDLLHTRVADGLKETGASLWTVQLLRSGMGRSQGEIERARVVGDVTAWSGGMNTAVLSREGLETAFTKTSAAIIGRYDVTYGRPDALIPPSRLSVEMRDRSLRVTAPRWSGR